MQRLKSLCKAFLMHLHLLCVARKFLFAFRTWRCRLRYAKQLRRIRHKDKGEKIKVLFIVSEIAKWKEQKLYEAMEQSGIFEPVIGLSAWNTQSERICSNDELHDVHNKAESFFAQQGDTTVRTVRVSGGKRVISDLSEFQPDIVFYTEPWDPCGLQDGENVSRFALTCYLPYYVPAWGNIERNCRLPLHFFLYRFFVLNSDWGRYYQKYCNRLNYVPKFIPTGHPALDYFSVDKDNLRLGNYVIYAPHHSIYHHGGRKLPQYLSTFDTTGMIMLRYAQCHREFKWVFKPHPLLKMRIKEIGLMNQKEICAYWDAWAQLGVVSEDGNYQDMFNDSLAMITDSGSFLMEYGATGKPLIRLLNPRAEPFHRQTAIDVCNSYYNVTDVEELESVLQAVLERGEDSKRNQRLEALHRAQIFGTNASENIVSYLRSLLRR